MADKMVHVSGGRATASAIPGAELVLVDGMGHDLPPATSTTPSSTASVAPPTGPDAELTPTALTGARMRPIAPWLSPFVLPRMVHWRLDQ